MKMNDYVNLYVMPDESLTCAGCELEIRDADAYLIDFTINSPVTAFVRCLSCMVKKDDEEE